MRVGALIEFYPREANLLGQCSSYTSIWTLLTDSTGLNENHGQRIYVRLRSPRNAMDFLPYEHVIDTLLHE